MKDSSIQTLSLCLLLGAGCTFQIRPDPRVTAPAAALVPHRARYFVAPEESGRVDSTHYFVLGIVHTWNIEIGAALERSFPAMLRSVFTDVAGVAGPEELGDADVVLTPAIRKFDVDSWSFASTLTLRLQAWGPGHRLILDEDLTANAVNPNPSAAFWGGPFAGVGVLKQSAEGTLEALMTQAAGRLRQKFGENGPAFVPGV